MDEFMIDFECGNCGKLCEVVEDSFDYPGTHCNGGMEGTQKTGDWYSKCCGAEYWEAN